MSKLFQGIILSIFLIILIGCSATLSSKINKTNLTLSEIEQGINDSKKTKSKIITTQNKVKSYEKSDYNQKSLQTLSGLLEVDKKLKRIYLLQLKAVELDTKEYREGNLTAKEKNTLSDMEKRIRKAQKLLK